MYSEDIAIPGGKITKAGPDDISGMYEIEKICRRKPFSLPEFTKASESGQDIYCCVAKMADGAIIGFGHMNIGTYPRSYHISALSVDPKKRSMGVGDALFRNMLNAGFNNQAVGFSLNVDEDISVSKMYKDFGFQVFRAFKEDGIRRSFMYASKDRVNESKRMLDLPKAVTLRSTGEQSLSAKIEADSQNKYAADLTNFWRERLKDYFCDDIDLQDQEGNCIRKNALEGLHIQSKNGYFIKLTSDNTMIAGKIDESDTLIVDSAGKCILKIRGVNDSGHVDFGHFSLSHGFIYSNDPNNESSLLIRRDEIIASELKVKHSQFRDPLKVELPNLNGTRMSDLLPEPAEIESQYIETAYDSRQNPLRGNYYNRKRIRGNLFIKIDENLSEPSSAYYTKIRQALIIAGVNPEVTATYNALIYDGRSDVVWNPNDDLRQSMSSTRNKKDKIRYNDYPETIYLNLDPASAGVSMGRNCQIYHNFPIIVAHESNHGFMELQNMQKARELQAKSNPHFDNELEKVIIEGVENRTREKLNIKKRNTHSGYSFRTDGRNVTSMDPVLIGMHQYKTIAPQPGPSQQQPTMEPPSPSKRKRSPDDDFEIHASRFGALPDRSHGPFDVARPALAPISDLETTRSTRRSAQDEGTLRRARPEGSEVKGRAQEPRGRGRRK